MNVTGEIVETQVITPLRREEMFILMRKCYANVSRAEFERDLDEKQWVIQIADHTTGVLCGFSTQVLMHCHVAGRPITALFSGDTIVLPECWGRNPLAQLWGRFALQLMDMYRDEELYWFLISKGYKTYRFLPLFFHEFHPRHDRPDSPYRQAIVDALARCRFPDSYDPRTGLVRAGKDACRLRAGVADITPNRIRDPHVRFFAKRNPGAAEGDELCCVAPLTRENFTPAAYRVIGQRPAMTVSVS